jgi:CDP-diacylglycerol--glycerol-3-phosphate 3-phosphatidyltransferase
LKNIPNALSFSRIPLSVLLLFLTDRPAAFLAAYAVTGLTDVLDGYLARRFKWETNFGSKLDGFADMGFMLALLAIVFGIMREALVFKAYVAVGVAVIALIKLFNLAFTKIKFKQWSTMHTIANKYTALPFYFIVPYCVYFREVPNESIMIFLVIVFFANLEETLILARSTEYDGNTKSIFHLNKASK